MGSTTNTSNLAFWRKIANEPNSCVKLVNKELKCALPCSYLDDVKSGVNAFIQTKITRYVPELGGILAGHGKLTLLSPKGKILFNQPSVYITVSGEFFIFAPAVGSTLKGMISKKSPIFLGCLVHGLFNTSLPQPHDVLKEDWIGTKANLHDEVTFTVTKLDLHSPIPYIRGDLLEISSNLAEDIGKEKSLSESNDSGISGTEESVITKPVPSDKTKPEKKGKSPGKKTKLNESQEDTLNTVTENGAVDYKELLADSFVTPLATTNEESRTKRKRKKKSDLDDKETEQEETAQPDARPSSPKKKRARVSLEQLAADILKEFSSSASQTVVETPKVKKEKRKLEQNADRSTDELASSILEDFSASFTSQASSATKRRTPAQARKRKEPKSGTDLDAMVLSLLEEADTEVSTKAKTPTATPLKQDKETKRRSIKKEKISIDLHAEELRLLDSVLGADDVTESVKTPKKKKKKAL